MAESIAEAIKSEVRRFASHKGYADSLRMELATAFRECSPTAEMAHAIGARLMMKCKWYPMPAEVYEVSQAIAASMIPEFTGLERTPEDIIGGSLADGLTESELELWRDRAEHGRTKAARDVAMAIVKRYESSATSEVNT